MEWNFAGFGMHMTLFPGGVILLLATLVLAGIGCWTLFQYLLAMAR
jgi:hypothetical protein